MDNFEALLWVAGFFPLSIAVIGGTALLAGWLERRTADQRTAHPRG